MKERIFGVLFEAAKVAVVIWGVILFDPWVADNLPKLDAGWRYLLSALVGAVALEGIVQLIFGWPRIAVKWNLPGDPVEIASIVARMSARNPTSQVFGLKVSVPPGGWLGHLILRGWARLGLQLHIRMDGVPLSPTVEKASKNQGVPTVAADDSSHGFIVELGRAPRRAGEWHWAEVRWEADSISEYSNYNVDYVLHHPNMIVRMLLLLTFKTSNVRQIEVVRK